MSKPPSKSWSAEFHPTSQDVCVYKLDSKIAEGLNLQYFDCLEGMRRERQDDGDELIILMFKGGGEVQIMTPHPLMWVEPERH